jgi:hypothetical protein
MSPARGPSCSHQSRLLPGPMRNGFTTPARRREMVVELNAFTAQLHGLGRKELQFLIHIQRVELSPLVKAHRERGE